jgi:LacI family transcriptional regulator
MTVSRVLNNAANVRPSTRQKVVQAIEELGYVPSGVAQSLRSKRTHTLALLVPDSANAFWTSVARGVEDAAQNRGYSVLLCNTDENLAKQQRYLDVIVGQQVDGAVIAPCGSNAQDLTRLRQRKIPTVVLDRYIRGWDVDTVIGDSIAGARALVRHLIHLGHQQIAVISGPLTTSTASDRLVGYRIALSEAGIAYDPRLVKEGEYRAISGERLTYQLLDEGLAPTAMFAANNALMLGAISALDKRGMCVPQDVALVSFGDLPNTSYFFPFLTVADLPSYEMGVNAAQLLLSRLEAQVDWKPRHVVLPARLIIRQSCGSRLAEDDQDASCLSVPITRAEEIQSLVKPLDPEEISRFIEHLADIPPEILQTDHRPSGYESDVNRLLTVLYHREADRVPHLETSITSKALYEYVLERELGTGPANGDLRRPPIAPDDQVEFAQRLGMDAVVCKLWAQPDTESAASEGRVKTWGDLHKLEPPRSLASQLDALERYVRAVQGTGVGVVVCFPSFFASTIGAIGITDLRALCQDQSFFEAAMDLLLDYWEQVMRAVCDRFAGDLAFLLVDDDLTPASSKPDLFMEIYPQRMKRLIAPAREHGKLVALHTAGKVDHLLPMVDDIGFDIIHPLQPHANPVFETRRQWAGRLALIGGFPTDLLIHGDQDEIEERVREYCSTLAPGGGYVLGASASITAEIPPESFVTMIRAIHKYGRYGCLGQEAATHVANQLPIEGISHYEDAHI